MSFLFAIWICAAVLALLAMFMMLALAARRINLDRRNEIRARRRNELIPAILDWVHPPPSGARPLSILTNQDQSLLEEITIELLMLVRGEDRDRLLRLLEEQEVVTEALKNLNSRIAAKREHAAAVLRFFDRDKVRSALLERLRHDKDLSVRLEVALALVDWSALPPLKQLIPSMGIDRGTGSRRLLTLFRKIAAVSPDETVALMNEKPPAPILIMLIDALGHAGHLQSLPTILAASQHSNMNVRAESLRALAQLGHPAAAGAVERGLHDEAWPVRAQAALCAGRVGLSQMTDRLLALLDDAEWWVRHRAAEALFELGDTAQTLLVQMSQRDTTGGHTAARVVAEKRVMRKGFA